MTKQRMTQSELDLTLYMITQVPFVKNLIEKNKKLKKENKSLKNLVYTLSNIQCASSTMHKERKKDKKDKKEKDKKDKIIHYAPIKQEPLEFSDVNDIEFVGIVGNDKPSNDVYVIKEEIIEQDDSMYYCDYCTYATSSEDELHKHKVNKHLNVYFNDFNAECIIEDTEGKIGYEELCNEFNVWFAKNTKMNVFPKKTRVKELMDEKYEVKIVKKPICWKGVRLNYQMPRNSTASTQDVRHDEEWDYGKIRCEINERFHGDNESVTRLTAPIVSDNERSEDKDEDVGIDNEGLEAVIKEDESRLYLFKRLEEENYNYNNDEDNENLKGVEKEKINNCDVCCKDKSFEEYYVFKRGKQEMYSCVKCWENRKTQVVGESSWTWSYHIFPGPAFYTVNKEEEEN